MPIRAGYIDPVQDSCAVQSSVHCTVQYCVYKIWPNKRIGSGSCLNGSKILDDKIIFFFFFGGGLTICESGKFNVKFF